MTRLALVRLRALGLVAAVLLLGAASIGGDGQERGAPLSRHHTGPAAVYQDSAIVVATAADAKTTSGWLMPLASLGAAVVLAIGFFGGRASSPPRASFAVSRRLIRASRRAPPNVPALQLF